MSTMRTMRTMRLIEGVSKKTKDADAVRVPQEVESGLDHVQNFGTAPLANFVKGAVAGAAARAWGTALGFGPLSKQAVTMLNTSFSFVYPKVSAALDKVFVNRHISAVSMDAPLVDRNFGLATTENDVPKSSLAANGVGLAFAVGAGLALSYTGGDDCIDEFAKKSMTEKTADFSPYLADMLKQGVGYGAGCAGMLAVEAAARHPKVAKCLGRLGVFDAKTGDKLLPEQPSVNSEEGSKLGMRVGGAAV